MSTEKVWYRFEVKKKDGSVTKLRIQDIPAARVDDAFDFFVNYFMRDEAVHRASGILNNPEAVKARRDLYKRTFSDPSFSGVICCSDDSNDVTDIIGVSIMTLSTDLTSWLEEILSEGNKTKMSKEENKYYNILYEYIKSYNPVKEFNLDTYYNDKGLTTAPEYRGLGIAEYFFKVRRLMCAAHGVPMTGGWMTAFGSQKAAARDGWETVCEVEVAYLAKKYDVTFTNTPPTLKFMLTKVDRH